MRKTRERLANLDEPPMFDMSLAFILTPDNVDYSHDPDNTLAAHAQRMNLSPVEAFIELNRRHAGRAMVWYPGLNQSIDAVGEMLKSPTVAMGLADSGAHVGQIMDASSPTWLLTYWVRDTGQIALEEAVRGWTSDTANLFGIVDRGVLRPGAFADVNVIDLDRLAAHLPEYRHDFPGGAGRYVQTGDGLRARHRQRPIVHGAR